MIRSILATCLLSFCVLLSASAQSNLAEPSAATYKKAKDIIIGEIKFNDVTLSDAVAFFQKESVAADPAKTGLNFVIKTPADSTAKDPFISMNLRKVPLSEALKYVAAMTNYRVKFEEQAIFLIPPETIKKTDSSN